MMNFEYTYYADDESEDIRVMWVAEVQDLVARDDELRALGRIGFEQLSTSMTQEDTGRTVPHDVTLRKR